MGLWQRTDHGNENKCRQLMTTFNRILIDSRTQWQPRDITEPYSALLPEATQSKTTSPTLRHNEHYMIRFRLKWRPLFTHIVPQLFPHQRSLVGVTCGPTAPNKGQLKRSGFDRIFVSSEGIVNNLHCINPIVRSTDTDIPLVALCDHRAWNNRYTND